VSTLKKKLFHEIKIRINGDTKKEIQDAVKYFEMFVKNYKGKCDFVLYYVC